MTRNQSIKLHIIYRTIHGKNTQLKNFIFSLVHLPLEG